MVYHEFHALDREKLLVSRPEGALNEWTPQAGLERKELADAGEPGTAPGRYRPGQYGAHGPAGNGTGPAGHEAGAAEAGPGGTTDPCPG